MQQKEEVVAEKALMASPVKKPLVARPVEKLRGALLLLQVAERTPKHRASLRQQQQQ